MKAAVLVLFVATHAFAQAAEESQITAPPPPPETDSPAAPPAPAPESGPAPAAAPAPAPAGSDAFSSEIEELALHRATQRVSVGPLFILFGVLPVEYERALTDKLSLFAGTTLSYVWLAEVFGVRSMGATLHLGGRYFPMEAAQAPAGFWVGTELDGGFTRSTGTLTGGQSPTSQINGNAIALGGVATVGYTYIGESGLSFSGGGGLGVQYRIVTGSLASSPLAPSGIGPALRLHANVGYAW